MAIINNRNMAKFIGKPVGYMCSDEEFAECLASFNQYRADQDEERFRKALETAKGHAYVAIDTWQKNGTSIRRGEVIYFKKLAMGNAVMVTRTKGSAQGFVWTCGTDEFHAHAKKAGALRAEREEGKEI